MFNEVAPSLKRSLVNYSIISAVVVKDLARLGGLSKEAAMELANSPEMINKIAFHLSELTADVVTAIADKKKSEGG